MPDDVPAKPEDPFKTPPEGCNVLRFDGKRTRSAHTEDGIGSFEDLDPDLEDGEQEDVEPADDDGTPPWERKRGLIARIWDGTEGPFRMAGIAIVMAMAIAAIVFTAFFVGEAPPRPISALDDASGSYAFQATGPRPIPPGWAGTTALPDPFLQWERDNPREKSLRYRGLLDDEVAFVEPTPIPSGMTVELKSVTPMGPSLLAWALDYVRLPRGTMDIRHAGSGFTLSLADYSLTPDGVLVASTSRAGALVLPLGAMLLLMWIAHGIHRKLESDPYATNPNRMHAAFAVVCAMGFMMAGVLSPIALLLLPVPFLAPSSFRRVTLALVSAWLAYLCVTTPIEPPNAALAHLYGPLGRSSWDIVWLGGLSALFLLATLRLPGQIITIRVAAPLIQDVRIVER